MKELGKKSLKGKIANCKDCTKTKNGFFVCSGKCGETNEDSYNRGYKDAMIKYRKD